RINANAALGSPKGNPYCGALDGHPSRQGHDLAEVNIRMKADPAFAWAKGDVMLHSIALKVRDITIIQFDRDIYNEGALGVLEGINPFREITHMRDRKSTRLNS